MDPRGASGKERKQISQDMEELAVSGDFVLMT